MAEFAALPLFTDAFLADTSHLSDAECGLYLRLLMTIWRSPGCRVPNDEAWLAKRFNRSVEQCRAEVMPLVKEFCKSDGNWLTQKRLSREFEYVKIRSKSQSERAKVRWGKEKKHTNGHAARHASGNAPTPTPTPTPKEERAEGALKGANAPVVVKASDVESDDGQIIVRAAEIAEYEKTFPNLKNIRGQVRLVLRLHADKPVTYRRKAIETWLGEKDQRAAERMALAIQKQVQQKPAVVEKLDSRGLRGVMP